VGIVRSPEDILAASHERERGYFHQYAHTILGSVTIPGSPFILPEIPWTDRRPPELGEHNAEVYGTLLGLTDGDRERLRAQGVI
jgi:crotonobetainyl-CoA:carnitine CoA-transferase CaiB-like acyl-CoA transferase